MSDNDIDVVLMDNQTGEAIEGIGVLRLSYLPRLGESIHYWQDGTEDNAASGPLNRRDFEIVSICHDVRYLPARGGRDRYIHTVMVFVNEVEDFTYSDLTGSVE